MGIDSFSSESHTIKRHHGHNLEPECSLATEESSNSKGAAGCSASNFVPNTDNDDNCHSTFLDASEQKKCNKEEIYPLSGEPYFSCILSKSQVQQPYQLAPPKYFWPCLPSARVPVIFCNREKTWKMTYRGDTRYKRFDIGWRSFVIDNNLKIGDGCVFELMDEKNLMFRVQILRGDIPPEFADDGLNPDKPLLIE